MRAFEADDAATLSTTRSIGTWRALPRPRLVLRTAVGGRWYTARNAALNRRTLPKPAANAIEDIGIVVSFTSRFAR
jgi:hypothetical protein